MKKLFMTLGLVVLCIGLNNLMAQSYWQVSSPNAVSKKRVTAEMTPQAFKVYDLQVNAFKHALRDAPLRGNVTPGSEVLIDFPLADGNFQTFKVMEAPVLDETLSAQYPDIKSYAGQSIDNPADVIRFSVTPLGVKSMLLSHTRGYQFIEPYSEDLNTYMVYQRKDRHASEDHFECNVKNEVNQRIDQGNAAFNNADDGILRDYRLVVSTNGEYANYFGGTVAQALAAINTTMTRVNGIYEMDFNITMTLISNTTSVIYTNAGTDPYGSSSGAWNGQLQNTLTSVIGEANYDIGHLFALGGNNGNAGCIGCVCVNGSKGSAFTSRTTPEGDPFDVDYVAHEMGHQFGGNHTWTFGGNEGTNVQMEPGSGTTIMGYAGITGPTTDVQPNSDPYFHAVSIEQITDYIKTQSCQSNTNTGNSVPSVNAGPNYTIPRGTPFLLDGSATDADGDALTYCWEQMDENNASTTLPSVTATSGVAFRSFLPSSSTQRSLPALATVLAGSTATTWEAVPNVGRTLNFRLTVRDNRAGGGTNESDNMVVTVNGSTGPFVVSSPNTGVTWSAGSTQTVTWDVAGTNGSPINAANVNILMSTDGGNTFSTTLASNTPNDGSQAITVPNVTGTTNRVKVEAANNIFYDISNSNFTITGAVACTATTPAGLASSSVTSDGVTLSWNAVTGAASYDVRYRPTGSSTWTTNSVSGTSTTLSGLTALTQYEAQVRSVCPDNSTSNYSSSVNFTTLEQQLNYCASNGNNVSDEFISNVNLGSINNSSGAASGGYADFTSISTDLTKGAANTITITPTWTGTVYSEGYGVWIDYNQDGDFTDSGEQVFSQAATTTTPVSGSFTVPSSASNGNTRMRVTMRYNTTPTPCGSFNFGEVEDYTVNIVAAAACNTPGGLAVGSITSTTASASWNSVSGAVDYTVRFRPTSSSTWTTGNISGTAANLTGLSAATTYEVQVRTNCASTSSAYSASVNFTTSNAPGGCTGGLSLPYAESFESGFGGWTQASGDDFNWSRNSGGTPSNNTGPSAAAAGSFYVYTESSNPNYPTKVATLNGPCFDLSGETSAFFNFQYHMFGASNMGNLVLEASDDNGTTWANVWSASGNQGNNWLNSSVDLSTYAGGSVQLRYVGTTGTTWQGDMAVDDISLTASSGPSCADVDLTFVFDNYPEETSWTITNAGGTVVEQGGTYGSQADGSTLVIDLCLAAGCYDFTINDSYGDGICCGFGNGSYSLTDAGGGVLASGGSFGGSETTNFCVSTSRVVEIPTANNNSLSREPAAAQHRPEFADNMTLFPNPATTTLTVQFQSMTEAEGTAVIRDVLGKVVAVQNWDVLEGDNNFQWNVSDLAEGTYLLEWNDGRETTVSRFVITR